MNVKTLLLELAFILTFFTLASGCGLSRPYPAIRSFTLEADLGIDLSERQLSNKPPLLHVLPVGAAAACETRKLVYKIGPNELSEDFYNEFTGLPARMIADETARILEAQGLFLTERTDTLKNPDYILEIFLNAFHGSFVSNQYLAIMEVKFTLYNVKRSPTVIFTKTYKVEEPLPDSGDRPSQLASGLGRALGRIIYSLSEDVKALGSVR
ncbi:MAG: PqiC family protein [Deltaproteobacteria bacterium]|nr:PqiC family protein [Deltaproteobacteria bacterium]